LLWLALTVWALVALWHVSKPLPRGVNVSSAPQDVALANIEFLNDVTVADAYGRPLIRQEIFDAILRTIGAASDFIVVDFFLFNDQRGATASAVAPHRALSGELRDALIARKQAVPGLRVLLVTDPINDVYGGDPSPDLEALRAAGVDVVLTDLDRLRDSNPIYSGFWRAAIDWWAGDGRGEGWLPNPLENGPTRVTFRAWARLLNFKANHRKVIIADDGRGGLVGLITSANPHDASSAHSNVALLVRGDAVRPLLESEIEIARFSGWRGNLRPHEAADVRPQPGPLADAREGTAARPNVASVAVQTEGAIRDAIVARLNTTRSGDGVQVALFYLSERNIVDALIDAAMRGVDVRLILDPNRDAFGRTKSGIPNRPAATELVAATDGGIKVRWYRTHGEQFHTKMLSVRHGDTLWFTLGSANFTRRNVGNYNLEANLAVTTPVDSALAAEVTDYFETLWANRAEPGVEYTTEFGTWADPSQTTYWVYRLMEASGLSTF
jgi:phosphatidylserine/phosphatidylglycerophosphate/cardiolipin synthase-like enzyme